MNAGIKLRMREKESHDLLDETIVIIFAEEKPCKSILEAFEIEDFSKEKRKQYNQDMYDEKRRNGELIAARNEGRAEGHAEGRAEALAETARRMLASGISAVQISELTGLSIEDITAL